MVIHQGRSRAKKKPETQPNALALDKKIDIAVAVTGKRARTEEHDDADNQHAQDSNE
jgi:hypothetical protein